MDKIGAIARSVEDCALVFGAIHGADPRDPASVSRPFDWPMRRDAVPRRIGYVKSLFEADYTQSADEGDPLDDEWKALDAATLDTLRRLGFELVPIELPADPPVAPLGAILTAEAAAAFDALTRSGRDGELVRQVENAWPNTFRLGQLIPAVEYIRANRLRTLLMRAMEAALRDVAVYVVPTFGGDNLLLTNLTGHPAVVLPNGFRSDGTPTSITFQGRLHGDAAVLAVAHAYQQATDGLPRRPALG
jgi:Asp-tRNA(Asn)/Glu-tRNA(Gln) amidotransferase A subunit family amidase